MYAGGLTAPQTATRGGGGKRFGFYILKKKYSEYILYTREARVLLVFRYDGKANDIVEPPPPPPVCRDMGSGTVTHDDTGMRTNKIYVKNIYIYIDIYILFSPQRASRQPKQ